MNQSRNNQIEQLLHQLNEDQAGASQDDQATDSEPEEIIDVYFVKREPEITVVDATPPQHTQHTSSVFTSAIVFFCLILPISSIFFQIYLMFHPPIATVTIIPEANQLTLNGTLHIGRLLHSIMLSQSQIIPTKGKGHQDATQAAGTVTFYNGLFTSQILAPGTIVTGSDGVLIITDQEADVPAGNPPSYGQVTVTAHAGNPGEQGNIAAYDINKACCANAILAKNTTPFTGGQNARDFQTVAKADINNATTPMKTSLAQSMQGALQGQLQPGEELITLPCSPTISSDHQAGEEATRVTVTVSQTCSGAAYNRDEVKAHAKQLLTSQAVRRLGAGYSLLGDIQVTTTQATIHHPTPTLTFSSVGTWVYGLSERAQEQIKRRIAGKTAQEARHIFATLPGIKQATLQWDETMKLPKETTSIHLYILVLQS